MTVDIYSCPCGGIHYLPDDMPPQFIEGNVDIRVLGGTVTYSVPRTYIAFHGVKAEEISDLAKQFAWEAREIE